jgi:DNA-binding PadR family transcriptional regulator
MPSKNVALSPTTFQILLSLVRSPLHGYGIKLGIEERTEGAISLGSGTLYQALARLELQQLVETAPAPDGEHDSRRGRIYALSSAGRAAVQRELALMQRTVASDAAQLALSGSDG